MEAAGDEDAGHANLARSYARVRAVHAENYASVGDAEWDALVLADEIDRLRSCAAAYRTKCAEVEELRKALEDIAGSGEIIASDYASHQRCIRIARKALEGKE